MKLILSYVSSTGVNPYTGELYPEGLPKYRTPYEIYSLLKLGFSISQRDDNLDIPLDIYTFYEAYKNEIKPIQDNMGDKNKNKGGNK